MLICYHHDFHPPDDVRIFAVPADGIQRWDTTAFVYDVRLNDLVLRHYAFADYWFAVNCTLDLAGNFVVEHGPIDWTFNCDISTPLFNHGANLYDVDLCLDVLVGPDGTTHLVIDEGDFAHASTEDWLTTQEQQGARQGLQELLGIINDPGLVRFLDQVVPFGTVRSVVPSLMVKQHLEDVPALHQAVRSIHYGRLTPLEGLISCRNVPQQESIRGSH